MESYRKLYRSADNRVFSGVAGGLAEYFGLNPTIVRGIFLILFFMGGGGMLLYGLFWLLMPKDPLITISTIGERSEGFLKAFLKAALCAVLLAIVVGTLWSDGAMVAFVVALFIGLYYFLRGRDGGLSSLGDGLGLHRSVVNKKFLGVFGGLSEKWNVDVTLLRVVGVILMVAGVGIIIPVYFLYALLVPKAYTEDDGVERVVIV